MANVPVRKIGGDRRETPPAREPLSMRWDPFHQVVPFLTGDEEPTRFTPDFQIDKTEDGFVFRADLFGIKENELDIAVTGNRLTIRGHIYDARERSYAAFTRAFTLPEGSDPNRKIRAALDGGVLTVMLSEGLTRVQEAPALPCDDPLERWESEGGGARWE
jgi:HSP20 family protein